MLNSPFYALCNQTVTIYNEMAATKSYKKTVIHSGAFFNYQRSWSENKTGTTAQNSFLLVVPQGKNGKTFLMPNEFKASSDVNAYTLSKGTKVLIGVGEDITTPAEWSAFIPAKVDNLVVVSIVDPQGLDDRLVHVEARG